MPLLIGSASLKSDPFTAVSLSRNLIAFVLAPIVTQSRTPRQPRLPNPNREEPFLSLRLVQHSFEVSGPSNPGWILVCERSCMSLTGVDAKSIHVQKSLSSYLGKLDQVYPAGLYGVSDSDIPKSEPACGLSFQALCLLM